MLNFLYIWLAIWIVKFSRNLFWFWFVCATKCVLRYTYPNIWDWWIKKKKNSQWQSIAHEIFQWTYECQNRSFCVIITITCCETSELNSNVKNIGMENWHAFVCHWKNFRIRLYHKYICIWMIIFLNSLSDFDFDFDTKVNTTWLKHKMFNRFSFMGPKIHLKWFHFDAFFCRTHSDIFFIT